MKRKSCEKEKTYLPPINRSQEGLIKKLTGSLASNDQTANYSLAIISNFNRKAAQAPRGERPLKTTVQRFVEVLGIDATLEDVLDTIEKDDDKADEIMYADDQPLQFTTVVRGYLFHL